MPITIPPVAAAAVGPQARPADASTSLSGEAGGGFMAATDSTAAHELRNHCCQQHHHRQQQQQQQQQQQWQRPPELQLPAGVPWHTLPPAGSRSSAVSGEQCAGGSSTRAAAAGRGSRQGHAQGCGIARAAAAEHARRGACLPSQHRNSSHACGGGGSDQRQQHLPSFLEWLSQLQQPAASGVREAADVHGTTAAKQHQLACVLAAAATNMPNCPLAQLTAVDWDADPRVTFAPFLADSTGTQLHNSGSKSSSQSDDAAGAAAAGAAFPSCSGSLAQQPPADAWPGSTTSRHNQAPALAPPGSQSQAAAAAAAAPSAHPEYSENGTWGSDCD